MPQKVGTDVDGHGYVDLGLPSGTLWATCNVGARKPEGYGKYYAWGETSTKSTYSWTTYKYANGDYNKLTKYCSESSYGNNGFTDNVTTLQSGDDPATTWGSGWRTPTKKEWQELLDNTTHELTMQNGVKGWLLTAKNGQSLFLPAAGYRWGGYLSLVGSLAEQATQPRTAAPEHRWRYVAPRANRQASTLARQKWCIRQVADTYIYTYQFFIYFKKYHYEIIFLSLEFFA